MYLVEIGPERNLQTPFQIYSLRRVDDRNTPPPRLRNLFSTDGSISDSNLLDLITPSWQPSPLHGTLIFKVQGLPPPEL
jgi:hypothetical protein